MSKTPNNKILEYIEDIIYMKKNHNGEGLLALQKEGREKYVTLEDVGYAFLHVMDDFTQYVDASQAITEVRLLSIVAALDEETKGKILALFEEHEDDLFLQFKEEETGQDGKEE